MLQIGTNEYAVDYDLFYSIVKVTGEEGLLNIMQNRFPHLDLYAYKLDWLDNRKYNTTFRGSKGDVRLVWEHNIKNYHMTVGGMTR